MTNVPIVTGGTAWTDDTDNTTYILLFHEALYYGTKLSHSLINPNQIRHFGIGFWDNPYDENHPLSIEHENINIPLQYEGTKLTFTSRAPTREELHTCPRIDMTDSSPWEPSMVRLGKVTTNFATNKRPRHIFSVQTNKQYMTTNPYSYSHTTATQYTDNKSDESILNNINPCLVQLQERLINQLRTQHPKPLEAPSNDIPSRRTFVSTERHRKASAESIAELWGIGLKRAYATLDATLQRGTRSAILPISRRYRSDRIHGMKRLATKFATDTIYPDEKSLNGHTCAQIFSTKAGFAVAYPMDNNTSASIDQALRNFSHDFGIPQHLTFDGATTQTGKHTEFMKTIRKYDIKHHVSSPRRPNENPAEGSIQLIKRRWFRIMTKQLVPQRFWDYGLVWICETGNISVSSSRYAGNRTSLEIITGETPDISEYLDFSFYDWVTYRSNAGLGEVSLGRWLGVSHKVGQLMSYWICTQSGHVISCVTVQRLTNNEKFTDEWKIRMNEFTTKLNIRLDAKNTTTPHPDVPAWNRLTLHGIDNDFTDDFQKVINNESIPEADTSESNIADTFDAYVNMEIGLPRGDDDSLHHAVVKRRAIDDEGKPIGISSNNPLTDSRQYEVEYLDGTLEVLSANVIAEKMLAQVDEEGHRQMMLDEIIDHRKDDSAEPEDRAFVTSSDNSVRPRRTTKGWEVCALWKDGSSNWIKLKDMKDSYPVELADYGVTVFHVLK